MRVIHIRKPHGSSFAVTLLHDHVYLFLVICLCLPGIKRIFHLIASTFMSNAYHTKQKVPICNHELHGTLKNTVSTHTAL